MRRAGALAPVRPGRRAAMGATVRPGQQQVVQDGRGEPSGVEVDLVVDKQAFVDDDPAVPTGLAFVSSALPTVQPAGLIGWEVA